MKTEKIIVSSLQEAVEELRKTYGDKAVVLSSRVIKRKKWWFLPFINTTLLEVTVGIPEDEEEKESFKEELEEKEKLYREIENLKRQLQEVLKDPKAQNQPVKEEEILSELEDAFSLRAQKVISRMIHKGVRKEIARKIVEDACGYDIELRKLDFKEDAFESLVESLKRHTKVEGEAIFDNPPDVMVLVGPTGVGKTTTIAKLAYLFKRKGKRVGVITLDSYRVGAVEQLKAFVKIMELPFKVADSSQELQESIRDLQDRDVILVDTAGRSQHDKIRLNELRAILEGVDPKVYLTLSANMAEFVMYESVVQFGMFPIKGLIFSKLDETSYPGNVINVAYRTKLPILCFTTGQTVPDDIVMASYEFLAKLILEEGHES